MQGYFTENAVSRMLAGSSLGIRCLPGLRLQTDEELRRQADTQNREKYHGQ